MTRDHTVAQRAIDAGVMTPDQAEHSKLGHALWNCISGAAEGVKPDLYRATLENGDQILLCTDGLTRRVTDEVIRKTLEAAESPKLAARELVAMANEAGGEDNITVVVARVRRETSAATGTHAADTAEYPMP